MINDEEHVITSVMGNKCYMSGCKNNRICKENGSTIPMFLFPEDSNLAKFWLGLCNRQRYECPYHGQAICKDHFRQEDLVSGNLSDTTELKLKPDVIPTANIPNICYSVILEYLKQKEAGGKLDPKTIGVDFVCNQHQNVSKKSARIMRLVSGNRPETSNNQKIDNQISLPKGVRITLKRKNADGTEELQPGPKIFITAKPKPTKDNETPSPSTSNSCLNRPCKITQRKIIQIPDEIQSRVSQVIKDMTQIIQDFMAFQIHITHLEQAVVCANEKITNYLTGTKGDVDPQYYKKFEALNNFLLLLYEIHGVRSSDVITFCTKIWRRAVDCHQEMKTKGKLKTFITAANGCLVTIVRVIDSLSILKNLWRHLSLKTDEKEIKIDDDWTMLETLIHDHIEDATEKLFAVDIEVHLTRQKILDIKKPSIRILEVAQMDVDENFVYITESTITEKAKDEKVEGGQTKVSLVSNAEKCLKKSSVLELGEVVEPEIPTPPLPVVQASETIPTIQLPAPTTIATNFQPSPSLTYPTMSTLPMQAQLIPTIQMDAFGNQSIVYQLAYQQVNPSISTPSITNSLETPQYAGIVLPEYNATAFQTPNHQASPTLGTNTSQEISSLTATANQVPITNFSNLEDQVIVVKSEPEIIKIKEEPEDDNNISKILETEEATFKQEPEWDENVE